MQIVSSHYMPCLLHIPKMMMNAMVTLQPMAEYSTILSLLFSTPLLLMFFSIILLMIPTFICAHCFVLPFPLLFVVVFNCIIYTHIVMNSKTSKMHTTFSNKLKLFLMITSFFLILEHSACHIHFLSTCHFLIKT